MSRYKGRQSAKAVEKDFRHFVGMVVPPGGLGNRLDAMYEFQTARQLKHFRAPRFAFASVFTRASDGGIQGTGSSTLQKTSLKNCRKVIPRSPCGMAPIAAARVNPAMLPWGFSYIQVPRYAR